MANTRTYHLSNLFTFVQRPGLFSAMMPVVIVASTISKWNSHDKGHTSLSGWLCLQISIAIFSKSSSVVSRIQEK